MQKQDTPIFNPNHVTETPTHVNFDDPTSVRQAALHRAENLWRYDLDAQWGVSVMSKRHQYEVRKVTIGPMVHLSELEIWRDGKRLAS